MNDTLEQLEAWARRAMSGTKIFSLGCAFLTVLFIAAAVLTHWVFWVAAILFALPAAGITWVYFQLRGALGSYDKLMRVKRKLNS